MKRLIFTSFLAVLFLTATLFAQEPDTLWTCTYSHESGGNSICITSDGGYIITGYKESLSGGGKDVYLVNTDPLGNENWSRTFGGRADDVGNCVQQTSDGGFVIFGSTESFGAGSRDAYLIRTDALGDEIWSRTFGGRETDGCNSGQQTADGGFILAGTTGSFGAGQGDVYLVKTDSDGNEVWSQAFGGSEDEEGNSVQQTSDGGYIIAGSTESYGAGPCNVYLIKTDSLGNENWYQTYWNDGTLLGYQGECVQQTTDGGYIVLAFDVTLFMNYKSRLLKTDSMGNEAWTQVYSVPAWPPEGSALTAYSVIQTADGGFAFTGRAYGPGGSGQILLKTDSMGTELWRSMITIITVQHLTGQDVKQTTDGGFAVTGSPWGNWSGDAYLVRYASDEPLQVEISLTPENPPITIPASGGSFDFNVLINNDADYPAGCHLWTNVTYPDSTVYGPLFGPNVLLIAGGAFIERDRTQYMGWIEPPGVYTYNAYVGTYPSNIVWDSDSFTFEKLETGDGVPVNSWSNSGEGFEAWVATTEANVLNEISLLGIYPNPFNPVTTLAFELPEAVDVKLAVYEVSGRLVATPVDGWLAAGQHEVTFNATGLASGVYIYQIEAGDYTSVKKMVLMK